MPRLFCLGGAGLFAGALAFLPYHIWDAFAFGEWSRLIAHEPGRFFFPTVSALTYQRPAFYLLQGWLWSVFGFHECLGRLLSLAFAALLAWSVSSTARGLGGVPEAGLFAWLLPFAIPDFLTSCAAGTTDVPVAALVAAAAAVLLLSSLRPRDLIVLSLISASAALTKPTAIPALFGLAIAAALFWPRAGCSRGRRSRGILSILAGLALAGTYFAWLAARLGISIRAVLIGALSGYYSNLASRSRGPALAGLAWLGPATGALLAASVLWMTLGLARPRRPVPFWGCLGAVALVVITFSAHQAASGESWRSAWIPLTTLVLVGIATRAVHVAPPERSEILFLLVWALPPFAAWALSLAYDTRLLSPAWPPLVLLLWLALAPMSVDIRGSLPRVAGILAGALVAAVSLRHVDGLDVPSARCVVRSVLRGRSGADTLRECLVPGLGRERETVARVLEKTGRASVVSNDGRLRFFLPGTVHQFYPRSCQDLAGHGAFVLLTNDSSRSYMENAGIPSDPQFWAGCTSPRTQLMSQFDDVAIFAVGR